MKPVIGKTEKDCLRSCLASILEKEYEEIRYVDPDISVKSFWEEYGNILNQFGFQMILTDDESYLNSKPKGFSIGMGKGKNGQYHAVICKDGAFHFDPSLSNGVKELDSFLILAPFDPAQFVVSDLSGKERRD